MFVRSGTALDRAAAVRFRLRATAMPVPIRPLILALALLAAPAAAQDASTFQAAERGHAARYEAGATGTPTASGEPYNPERLTLSHPTLPFGTIVRLTNLKNGQTVTARVNDRAAASGELRVKLSARTADHLGLPARGGAIVLALDEDEAALLAERAAREKARTRAARTAAAAPLVAQTVSGVRYTVQLASFSDEARAVAKADEVRGAWVLPVALDGRTVYRVCYGVFGSLEGAAEGLATLGERGLDGFVKTLDAPAARADTPVRSTATGD